MFLRFVLAALLTILFNATGYANEANPSEQLTRAEINELFLEEMKRDGIIEKIGTPQSSHWHSLPHSFYGLIKSYIGCYPNKFYAHTKDRSEEFFMSMEVPGQLGLLDQRYLTTRGFQQHQADVKGYFLFDLQEKEAVIGMLNYKGEAFDDPTIEIYVSPTASAQTVGKGVEFIRSQVNAYMTPQIMRFLEITHVPPFTIKTVTCPE